MCFQQVLLKKKKNIYHTLEKNHILTTYVHLHLQVIMSENIQERNLILVEVCVVLTNKTNSVELVEKIDKESETK